MGFNVQFLAKLGVGFFVVSIISGYIYTIISFKRLSRAQDQISHILNEIIDMVRIEKTGNPIKEMTENN